MLKRPLWHFVVKIIRFLHAIRQASSLSTFVGLHQDAHITFQLQFLNDISERSATTVFYNETHKIPSSLTQSLRHLIQKSSIKNLLQQLERREILYFYE